MGRIEDALKRAAMSSGAEQPGMPLSADSTNGTAPVGMEEYPRERDAGGVPPGRPREVFGQRRTVARVAPPPVVASPQPIRFSEAVTGKVVLDPLIPPVCLEQYRRLATTLHEMQAEKSLRIVMISSAMPREGKTLTSSNLALTLSASYRRRVLLVDGDLRRPSVHEVFGLSNRSGLAEGLATEAAPIPLYQVSACLTVLTAGRPEANPTAGLASERMRSILNEAAGRFDWVIVDSPPVGLLSDARLIAGYVDGVILVIGAGSTDYRLVQNAVEEFGSERILGTVLNRVNDEAMGSAHYYGKYGEYYTRPSEPDAV